MWAIPKEQFGSLEIYNYYNTIYLALCNRELNVQLET